MDLGAILGGLAGAVASQQGQNGPQIQGRAKFNSLQTELAYLTEMKSQKRDRFSEVQLDSIESDRPRFVIGVSATTAE